MVVASTLRCDRHRAALHVAVKLAPGGERRSDDRNGLHVGEGAAQEIGAARLALIEDDDADRAGDAAFAAFCSKVQVPRWISTILPDRVGRKVGRLASARDDEGSGLGGSTMSFVAIERRAEAMLPAPEYCMVVKSVSATKVFGVGDRRANSGGVCSSKRLAMKGWTLEL